MTLIMLFACLKNSSIRDLANSNLNHYCLFIFFFGISSIIYSTFNLYLHDLFGKYLVSVVGLWSTYILFKKGDAKVFIYALLCIGLFDAVVTIFQFMGLNAYAKITEFLHIYPDSDFEELLSEKSESFITYSIPGLVGATSNGPLLMVCGILSWIFLKDNKRTITILLSFFFLISVFLTQQRMALIGIILFDCFLLVKFIRRSNILLKFIMLFAVTVGLVYIAQYAISFSEAVGMRYSILALDSTNRDYVYDSAFKYIADNPIFANIYDFRLESGYSPHNLFLNAYIFGGIGTFITILILLISQIKAVWHYFFGKASVSNVLLLIMISAYFAYTFNGLTHNESIITGNTLIWCLWGGIVAMLKEEKSNSTL